MRLNVTIESRAKLDQLWSELRDAVAEAKELDGEGMQELVDLGLACGQSPQAFRSFVGGCSSELVGVLQAMTVIALSECFVQVGLQERDDAEDS